MINRCFKFGLLLMAMLVAPLTAYAISGTYDDAGGGTYWCNVYVHDIAASKSYGWCTGDSEDQKMNEFREFTCENGGKVSTEHPTWSAKFRYNSKQSKDYDYKNSEQQIYVMTNDGALHKIYEAPRGSNGTQTDYTYGVIKASWDGSIFTFRIAFNDYGLREVKAVQVESDSYFYQSNFWHRDYWFYIHARYLKGVEKELSLAREPKVEWNASEKVKVSADNSWLPSKIGIPTDEVTNFKYTTNYDAKVVLPNGSTYSSASFKAENRNSGSIELKVPLDNNFTVSVTRNTNTSFDFNGRGVTQNQNENAVSNVALNSSLTDMQVSFDQVNVELRLQWTANGMSAGDGDYQIYRTELDENGRATGKREQLGSTGNTSFTDNANYGLELNKTYRYEVFQQRKSWGDFEVSADADKPIAANVATTVNSTAPVVPLHLVQDTTDIDNVKMDWTFGNIPKTENDITFKVHRIEPGGAVTRNYLNVTVPRDAGKATFSDEKPASICSNYGYFLQLDLADNKVHLYSDTVYAHVIGSSKVTSLDVTKGTAGTDVVVKWKAHQIGTLPTIYHVQRRYIGSNDWITIQETEGTGTMYNYTDRTAEPGRYYEYRVIAYASDCDAGSHVVSNQMRDVGFARATGVISGRVQFEGGTAVNDVRVSISGDGDANNGSTYHSRSVLEPGNSLTFTNLGDVINDGKPFTLQFYVRPELSDATMTLLQKPVPLLLSYNSEKKLYDVKMSDAVVGAIPAGKFSQLSVISDGSSVSTMLAGNENAQNAESVTPQRYSRFEMILNEKGNTLAGWTFNPVNLAFADEWCVSDDAFASGPHETSIHQDKSVSNELIGMTADASVMMRAPWGATLAKVTATLYNEDDNALATIVICDDKSAHDDWKTYSASFEILPETKYIRYKIVAKDKNFWKGFYGPQFKDMIMAVNGLDGNNWVLCPDFDGNVDEIRVWNRALGKEEIDRDADRLISGESDGLKAYITFDEGLEEYAFDSSLTNGVPNGHHITVGANTRPSDVIPTSTQLSAYGMTNERGEYEIRGIPFTGSGTRYSVYPTKGIHSFNPTSRSAFIGGTSLTINSADFIDVSSFKVSGTIRYSGTTVPVDSVSFYVDGTPCNKNDKLIVTDSNGNYEISVPIGSHYIEARRAGHTFEGAGRYPAGEDETYEFLTDTHIDFFDNTVASIAGRVTGGETEGKKPLGYGVSENTIGQAVIKLSPLDHPQRMLNAVQHIDGTTTEWVANSEDVAIESTSKAINSTSYRAGGDIDKAKYIYIKTDAATGEFSAKLPPIRYKVESVTFPNNPTVERDEMFQSVPAIDLTHPTDTVVPDTIYNESKTPMPLFKCNKKLMLTYRATPVMDITQKGVPAGVFGVDTITVRDAGKDIKLPIFEYDDATKKVTYNYGYPIFQMGRTYEFKIRAYEPYFNYDEDKTNGKRYDDLLRDSVVTFDNELGQAVQIAAVDTTAEGHTLKRGDLIKLDSEQVPLDSIGEGVYKWNAGLPSLSTPYTRNMNASMIINKRTQLWRNDDGLNAIIAGVIPTGNNFITAGPDHVQMVLRDPPGDASNATWATDTITTDYTYTVRGIHNNTEIGLDLPRSLEIDVMTGAIAFYKVTYNQVIHENGVHWKYDVNKTWDNHTSVTYTNGQSTSTSSSNTYVGRDGDLFIGFSTNYIIGAADKVGLIKQDDGSWGIGMEETVATNEKFKTHFEYSQKYIETTLFNNIKRTRNSKLKHINSLSEMEEYPAEPTYYTLLTDDDEKFGTSNNDKEVWGAEAKEGSDGPSYYARFPKGYEAEDSVLWCNEIIRSWKKTLADNEEDKIKAFNDSKYKIGNESFETGSTRTITAGSTTKEVHNSVETFTTSVLFNGKNGYLLDKMGIIFITNTDIGYHQTKYDVDETTRSEKFSYTLNDTQRNNAHTVDIFNSPNGWGPIFRTRGGQSRCPYEDETKTKYYRPGLTLDYATMKIDNPHISMPIRDITDIPAGHEAQVQVKFTNESQAHEALSPAVVFVDPLSNPNGLQIYMDGQPLVTPVELWIEYGVPLIKTLTIRQSDHSILDFNDIKLILANTCKPAEWIYENVTFSAHFVPAAPEITLKLDKNVLNQRAMESGEQLRVTISDINRLFTGLKGVRLKYHFSGDTQWITAHEWMTDVKYCDGGTENDLQTLLPSDQPNIVYDLDLPNIDGSYVIAAESICDFGGKDYVATTPVQTVIRDTRGPKLLGQAYPNTGILLPTDDIRIKFNEDIRESYLTKDENFFITGSLNDSQVNHNVSLQFNGTPIETSAYLPISNTSFAASLWFKRKGGGTLLEHGTNGNEWRLGLNERGQVFIEINGESLTSTETVSADKWVFLALNYVKGAVNGNNTFTLLVAEDGDEKMLFEDVTVPDYNGEGQLTLGRDFTGMMHELVMWNKNNPVRTQLGQKDEAVAPFLPGLIGYWKMNEGFGTDVIDYASGRNIHMPAESWNIENSNLAAHLDGQRSIKIPIDAISLRPTDSYVLETWFRGEKDKNAGVTLLSVTDQLSIGFDNDNSLILETYNRELPSLTSSGVTTILSERNYSNGAWHHLAINVHRGVGCVVYIDGQAIKTIAENELPALAGDYLYVGTILKRDPEHEQIIKETQFFTGDVDEVRIWNVACDGTSINANRYNQVDTTNAAGLLAYYPMEHSRLDSNNKIITEFSLDNKAPSANASGVKAAIGEGVTQAVTAPAIRTSPLKQNLDFDFTASNNEIYINVKTLPARMHGNLLTFVVKNVRDIHDNLSETITWSAQVDYNTLEWTDNSIIINKSRLYEETTNALLHNKGRESEHFTLSGLPTWIRANQTSGVLAMDETQTIDFVIGADAPVGTHLVFVYAINDDEISTPLMLQITVRGNEPYWWVDPEDFESSMNVVGQIYFNDKICSNPNTQIAAFVNDKLCGSSSPKLVTSRDSYFVNMTIYGVEDINNEQPITFRIYDANKGVILGDVKTIYDGEEIKMRYLPNDVVGNYDNPLIWRPTNKIEQRSELKEGWNWISLYAEPDKGKSDLENVFGHSKVFNTIKNKEGFAMNSGTAWTSTGLTDVKVGEMYKIKVKNNVMCGISGNFINTDVATQTIAPGWNWIGPLSIYNLSLQEAFADLNPTRGDVIKSKTQVAFYDGYKWEGELTAVIPGLGYYYKSNNDKAVTFHYPTISDSDDQSQKLYAPRRAPADLPFTPVDHHQFSDNMNVVAQLRKDNEVVTPLCVAAFIDGECRGVSTVTESGLYLITIAGNAEEAGKEVSFATVFNNETIWCTEKLSWVVDRIYGDLDEPQVLNIADASGIIDMRDAQGSIKIYPTIVTDVVNVKADDLLKSASVYSVNGSLMDRYNLDGNNAVIDLSHLARGVYFVEVHTQNGDHLIKQIIKQ